HAGALNLGLLMRQLVGIGTPRSLQGCAATLLGCLWGLIQLPEMLWDAVSIIYRPLLPHRDRLRLRDDRRLDLFASVVLSSGLDSRFASNRRVAAVPQRAIVRV